MKSDKKRNFIKQFSKFAIVGIFATIINLIFLYFFTEFFSIYYMISAVFAFFIADFSKYILNKLWTFNEKLMDNFLKTYYKFFTVSISALILNLFFLYFFTEFLKIYYVISQVLAIAITLWINFLGNKFWTFKK